jgi:hypothetical protein
MKRSEAIKKVRDTETAIEVQRIEKLRQMEAEMDLENRESNRNRARSITVGTAFGGTTEIMMRVMVAGICGASCSHAKWWS